MEQSIGFKELYEVSLKATYPIEVNGETIEVGETIAVFDSIQLANFQEIKDIVTARGGHSNEGLIWWENTKEIKLSFSQGVFSKTQLALMINAKIFTKKPQQAISVQKIECLESDESGDIVLSQIPSQHLFVYEKDTGKKIKDWVRQENTLNITQPFKEVVVDYCYDYFNGGTYMQLGTPFAEGTFSLSGKTRVKDDVTGKVTTGIINIPKLRLMSDLSMRLGNDATPQIGRFDAVAIPVGGKGEKKVMDIIFLNDDIDADM